MIDFTGFLVILGLVAAAFVGGIVIGHFMALRQAQNIVKNPIANLPTSKEKPRIEMWGYSSTEAWIWYDTPKNLEGKIRDLPGVSKTRYSGGNKLYIEFDPRFDLDETIRKIEVLG